MGLDQAVTGLLVAGIGFRRGTDADEIAALIERALAALGADRSSLTAVATAADRAAEPAIRAATARFGLSPQPVAAAALQARDAEIVTRSARIEQLRGVGSLAEATALASAGPQSRLALPRITSAGATCALAVRCDTTRDT
ncbi:cobalamin biosynthesis protein [Methylobacterium sp. 391_Methyba4]|uniref:cobalamin biosynthesis protein n=1 Tax=Methylobacterium sp. 391_Methyba4 TaxID=3038924 RepID=UPI00241F4F4D|nr:cobalamin biosynthesis protein [Methylobacterium sp. 391_Methyba4]WFS05286.1 cobalamin biosynthesis protein [Methylobacterium sp. 391_Methyba4]